MPESTLIKRFAPLLVLLIASIASGATLFSDDFNRANNATVDATNWTENAAGDWSITTNKVRSVNPITALVTTTSAHAAIANVKVSYKRALTGSSWDTGILVRANSTGTSGYFLDPIGTGPASTMDIWRIDGPAMTNDVQVGSTVTGLTLADGDVYGLEVSGTGATVTLKAYLNGALVLTVTDTTGSRITSPGQTGIINWNNTNDFDDFLVESLAGSTPVPVYMHHYRKAANDDHADVDVRVAANDDEFRVRAIR